MGVVPCGGECDRAGVASLAVLRDLPQPPADHLQLLRQLLHLLLQAQEAEEGESEAVLHLVH